MTPSASVWRELAAAIEISASVNAALDVVRGLILLAASITTTAGLSAAMSRSMALSSSIVSRSEVLANLLRGTIVHLYAFISSLSSVQSAAKVHNALHCGISTTSGLAVTQMILVRYMKRLGASAVKKVYSGASAIHKIFSGDSNL